MVKGADPRFAEFREIFAGGDEVNAWHAAGIAAGGTTCEDPPGLRPENNLYLAYLRDPDGNKLCAYAGLTIGG